MEQFIWETPEELDQKLAQRVRKIRKRRSITQEKLASMDLADELRNIFTQVPYKDIQEVINETR